MNNSEFQTLLHEIYGGVDWPKPLHVLRGVELVEAGAPVADAAKEVGTTARALQTAVSAPEPVEAVLGIRLRDIPQQERQRAIQILGQLLVGRAAEKAFEDIYRAEMESQELELRDVRESRTDTDYRLYNGQGRPVYRINIKFHGSLFRRAPELVGLAPDDCFALATYKIHGALRKQDEEGLPYIFTIVGERSISGESVGSGIPSRFVEAAALFHSAPKAPGRRDFEDRVVDLLARNEAPVFRQTYASIRSADWYVLSARKADLLVRKNLYDRVFALRIRGFARVFRGAELDMHFSLSQDLVRLHDFLNVLRTHGHAKVVTLLERGEF
jgi:hypothetical protein